MSDDRVIGVARTPESHWRAWLEATNPAPLPATMCPGAAGRLVVIAPHPDDEVLACGGLLAMHAQRGGEVAVIGVTDGEASHPASSATAARRLGVTRRLERERGLAWLGVDAADVTRLGLPDGQVSTHLPALRSALEDALRPGDRVVSTWPLDGHPDHDATGAEAEQACRAKGCTWLGAPVWMWHWSRPDDVRIPWHTLRSLRLPAEVLARKRDALAEHLSQLEAREGLGAVLDPAIRSRALRDTEYYFIG